MASIVNRGRERCDAPLGYSTQAQEPLQYRSDIDGLRAIAVLAVLVFHAFSDVLPGGFVGVDVFFVISGFLISRTIWNDIHQKIFSIKHFYERRVRRIFPSLIVVLVTTWLIGLATLSWDEFARLGKYVFASSIFGTNFFLWREGGYFDIAGERKPLLHLWSLSIEEQFYLFWPLLLLFVSWNRGILARSLLILGTFSLVVSTMYIWSGERIIAFYNPLGRIWELIIGGAIAYVCTFNPDTRLKLKLGTPLGLILITTSCLFFTNETPFPGLTALLPTVGAALILASPPAPAGRKSLLQTRFLVAIGLISYPLYLWHWPLLSFLYVKLKGEIPATIKAGALLTSFILAWLTYRYVERPLRYHRSQNATLGLVGAVVTLGVIGGITYLQDGFVRLRAVTAKAPFIANPRALDDWFKGVRSGSCHIQDATVFLHSAECIELVRPLVLLWGDSHASALYPGLRAMQDKRIFGLTQLTQAHCPPLLGIDSSIHKHCNAINDRILNSLNDSKPDVIILHAAWIHHLYPRTVRDIKEKLVRTLREIKLRSASSRIIVVGPQVQWFPSLPEILTAYVEKTGMPPPVHMEPSDGEVPRMVRQLETELKPLVETEGAEYLSPRDIFCEADRCLTRVGDGKDDLVVFDYGHLTTAGSTFFWSRVSNQISCW
jgi:peptidoglycan/LPS O-acetylase OafA/YrhL